MSDEKDELDDFIHSKFLNISFDYSNIRDILQELYNQIEHLKKTVSGFTSFKEISNMKLDIEKINQSIEDMGHKVAGVVATNQTAMSQIDKKFESLFDDAQKSLKEKTDELQTSNKEILDKNIEDAIIQFRKDLLGSYSTIDMHNNLLFKVEQLDDKFRRVLNMKPDTNNVEVTEKILQRLNNLEQGLQATEDHLAKQCENVETLTSQVQEVKAAADNMKDAKPLVSSRGITFDEHIDEVTGQMADYEDRIKEIEEKLKQLEENGGLSGRGRMLSRPNVTRAAPQRGTVIKLPDGKGGSSSGNVTGRSINGNADGNGSNIDGEPINGDEAYADYGDYDAEFNRIDRTLQGHLMRIINLENLMNEVGPKVGVETTKVKTLAIQTDESEDLSSQNLLKPPTSSNLQDTETEENSGHIPSYNSVPGSVNCLFMPTSSEMNQDQDPLSTGNTPGTGGSAGNRSAASNSSRPGTAESNGGGSGEKWGPAGTLTANIQDNDLIRRPASAHFNPNDLNQSEQVSRPSSNPDSIKNSSRVSMRLPSEGGSSRGIPVIPGLKSLNFDNSADSVRDKMPSGTGKWSVRSQTYEELETLTRLLRENQERIIDKIKDMDMRLEESEQSSRRVRKQMKEAKGLDQDEAFTKALSMQEECINEIKQNCENYITKDMINTVIGKISSAIEKILQKLDLIEGQLPLFLTKREFVKYLKSVTAAAEGDNTTAGATRGYHCLLCGREKGGVVGMITDSEIARLMGEPTSCAPLNVGGDNYVLSYSKGPSSRPKTSVSTAKKTQSKLPKISD